MPLNPKLGLSYVQTRLLCCRLLQVDLHGRTNFRKSHGDNEVDSPRVLVLDCSSIYGFSIDHSRTRGVIQQEKPVSKEGHKLPRRVPRITLKGTVGMAFGASAVEEKCKKKGLSLIRWRLSAERKDERLGLGASKICLPVMRGKDA